MSRKNDRLEKSISSRIFILKAWKFIERTKMDFSSPREARKFLTFFLVAICLNEDYTSSELEQTYKKIKKFVGKKNRIFSGDLPVKQQRYQVELGNVYYNIVDSTCSYEKKAS